ncbi:unnamed protein product [Pylaiella littoralis]
MELFPRLQKLSLERNQLESDAVFDVLSKLPALRELNLAFNYFTGVNLRPDTAESAFPLLEGLDLGFNYIESESNVVVVALFGRLQRIVLYGNPLAGPTGEDPLGLCVENLIAESDRVRGDYASYPVEVITELPRIKQTRVVGGGGGGGGDRTETRVSPWSTKATCHRRPRSATQAIGLSSASSDGRKTETTTVMITPTPSQRRRCAQPGRETTESPRPLARMSTRLLSWPGSRC